MPESMSGTPFQIDPTSQWSGTINEPHSQVSATANKSGSSQSLSSVGINRSFSTTTLHTSQRMERPTRAQRVMAFFSALPTTLASAFQRIAIGVMVLSQVVRAVASRLDDMRSEQTVQRTFTSRRTPTQNWRTAAHYRATIRDPNHSRLLRANAQSWQTIAANNNSLEPIARLISQFLWARAESFVQQHAPRLQGLVS